MGALLLEPRYDPKDLQTATETDEVHPDIMGWIQSAHLQDIVKGLDMQVRKLSIGAVRLSAGVYIPLTDQWTYTEGETKVSPGKDQYEVLCCTTDEGILTLTSDAIVLAFTKPPHVMAYTVMAAMYKFGPEEMTYDHDSSALADAEQATALRKLVPNWNTYFWSCLHRVTVLPDTKVSLQIPRAAQHCVVVNMDWSDLKSDKLTLDTTEMTWKLNGCDALHIRIPTKDLGSSFTCDLSSAGMSCVNYIYGWLPTEEERSRIKECSL